MFKEGDIIVDIRFDGRVGEIVFIHPTDDPNLVVDFGKEWSAAFEDEIAPATKKQAKAFKAKYRKEK